MGFFFGGGELRVARKPHSTASAVSNAFFCLFTSLCILEYQQLEKTLEELGKGNYTVCFDATPYRCECFGIGLRFVDQTGQVQKMIAFNFRNRRTVCAWIRRAQQTALSRSHQHNRARFHRCYSVTLNYYLTTSSPAPPRSPPLHALPRILGAGGAACPQDCDAEEVYVGS